MGELSGQAREATASDLWRCKTTGMGGVMKVHRGTCASLGNAKHKWPWKWAEGRSLAEVFAEPWNVPCWHCQPHLARLGSGGGVPDGEGDGT